MSGAHERCFLCGVQATLSVWPVGDSRSLSDLVECPSCGSYLISDEAEETLREKPAARPVLIEWVKAYPWRAEEPFLIERLTVTSAALVARVSGASGRLG